MKVLYIMDSLGTGGSERSTADLWYFLRKEKVEISIVALRHRKEGIENEILTQGFSVHFLQSKGLVSQSREIVKYIRDFHPDVVHSVLFKSNLRTRLARMQLKFVHVESLVNCSYDKIRLKDPNIRLSSFYLYKYLDKFTAGWVDKFHAVTEGVKSHYHQALHIPEKKISAVHRGRGENKFLAERPAIRKEYLAEFGLPDNTIMVIHVGRQEYQKGHLDLLKAIEHLSQDEFSRCAFLFLGREGNSTAAIQSFLQSHSSGAKLIWLGHRQDVQQLLVSADIFVFPSLYEGIGGALIEAQAASLPIICSDIAVLNEVVVKNKSAFMHENQQQLTTFLSRLIGDQPLRNKMGEAGLANFRANFSIDKVNQKMLDFYKLTAS